MVEERRDDDLASKDIVASTLKYQYVWGVRYIDAPICRDEDTGDGSGGEPDGDCIDSDDEHLYYMQDANFNVTALVDGSDGDVVERYMYSPYGEVKVLDADWSADADGESDYENEILYCGYWYDNETGLYHVRRRYLHSTLGRWLSRDPIGYQDGMGLYEYVGSMPPATRDPTGLIDADLALPPPEKSPGRQLEEDLIFEQREWERWQRWERDDADQYSRGKVALRVSLISAQSGGSIEMHRGGKTHQTFVAPEGSAGARVRSTFVSAFHEDYGGFRRRENRNDAFWSGHLSVWTKTPTSGWLQVCPDYWWAVTIENICCPSERLTVRTSGSAGPKATYQVPPSMTHTVPEGRTKDLEKARLAAIFTSKTPGRFRTRALATIAVSCER